MFQPLTIEQKFSRIKDFYQKNYKIIFKPNLDPAKIEELFKKMHQFEEEMRHHFVMKPGLQRKFFKSAGILEKESQDQ